MSWTRLPKGHHPQVWSKGQDIQGVEKSPSLHPQQASGMFLYLQLPESMFIFNIQVDNGKGSNTGKRASNEIDDDGEVSDIQDDDASDISQIPSTSSSNSKQGKVCI